MRRKFTSKFTKKAESMGIHLVKHGNVFRLLDMVPTSYMHKSLQVGDEIFSVNGLPVCLLSGQQFTIILKAFPMGAKFSLSYYREENKDIIMGSERTETLAKVDTAMLLIKQFKGQLLEQEERRREKIKVYYRQIKDADEEIARLARDVEAKKKELDDAKIKLEDVQEKNTCKVCMDQNVDVIIEPCCHYCACEQCISKLNLCPICRVEIMRVTYVHPG